MTVSDLWQALVDPGTWHGWDEPLTSLPADPDYRAAVERARLRTGLDESVVTGEGRIAGRRVALVACEFGFLAGSIGVDAGERLTLAVERATRERLPLLASPASGGTRMQEGTIAFVQMVKVAAAVAAHKAAALPYLVYLRHPTTGGVLASWGSLGHVTAAEPGALIGFLGPRVHQALYDEEFPSGVQTAENLLAHGLLDAVLPTRDLAAVARRALNVLCGENEAPAEGVSADGAFGGGTARGGASVDAGGAFVDAADASAGGEDAPAGGAFGGGTARGGASVDAAGTSVDAAGASAAAEGVAVDADGACDGASDGAVPDAGESIRRSRRPERPGVRALLRIAATEVTPLSGTGAGESDPGLLLALARISGTPCVVLGHDRPEPGTAPPGAPVPALGPAGLREARRGMRIAAELGLPLLTVVDTAGAALSVDAEQGGLAGEIARSLADLVTLSAPTLCLLLGQGAGGGALALLPADRVLAARHAWLSPLPPEGASAILYRTTDRAFEVAARQGVRSADLLAHGIVDRVVEEEYGGARHDSEDAADDPVPFLRRLGVVLGAELAALRAVPPGDRLAARRARHRRL
ncbi:carboxyl transferase domain-containing protein [Streptantibioticus silvisoli]|uniref:Acetyl-coenzyme A carboxylase carboxyl transferase subunits beta/alpha n=1 Tax=Streptantibioticus silvisoli TaxID=2705255 RepID=A0ABT6W9W5_9ACTN|nr:carboxyl transferase domain-containing protein [Streptantibioticus silvisoli]MDI5966306.1 carboxyl transferase domain-containing protein [Streptantibioticus silvisoli]